MAKEAMQSDISDVLAFWDAHPCQAALSDADDRRRYFQEISQKRYGHREWHVPTVARFDAYRDKDVLEIGCGIATDGLEFARHGARYVGVDLTPQAIQMARERFALFEVPGRFEVANAEQRLPFPNESFDHVYSFGVIHHAPYPDRIASEIYRVLRPGGTMMAMLYNRTSINYYVEIMFLRKLLRWSLMPAFMPAVFSTITGFDRWKLEGHREALHKKLTKDEWISMNTDGPFCPLARVYNRREAAELFSMFGHLRQETWEFNTDHWPFVRRLIPQWLERKVGRLLGWHRIIYGAKA
jgi:ubiquinone/menaquinone biosynthesis C-methylase UbiE